MGATERIFLGWDRPLVHAAAGELLARLGGDRRDRGSRGEPIDFSGVVVCTLAARTGRLLLVALARAAGALIPPRIVTPDELLRVLHGSPGVPVAGEAARLAAWTTGLAELGEDERAVLGLSADAATDELRAAAARAMRAVDELRAELVGVERAVAAAAGSPSTALRARWEALERADAAARARLDRAGLVDGWSCVAAGHRGGLPAPEGVRAIVLVGVVRMAGALAAALAATPAEVVAMVGAPESHAEGFDELGALRAGWQAPIEPAPGQWVVVDSPTDQADAAIGAIAELAAARAPDEITLGVADRSFARLLQERARRCGLVTRDAAGSPVLGAGPARLLALASAFWREGTCRALGALARHEAAARWLESGGFVEGAWLAALDRYAMERLPTRVPREWLGDLATRRRLSGVVRGLDALTGAALCRGESRPLSAWAPEIGAMLARAYGTDGWADESDRRALDALAAALGEMAALAGAASVDLPVRGHEAVAFALDLTRGTIPPAADPGGVDMVGWLELAFDDAPVVIATGMNEGHVPASAGEVDPFLPEAMRRALGLTTSDRLVERDAYQLALLVRSHEHVRLISTRADEDAGPTVPSRLLMRGTDDAVASRLDAWRRPGTRPRRPAALGRASASRFPLRPVAPAPPVTTMRVTGFRDYLRSPYAFYLRHVLGLREVVVGARELDAARFGELVHEAVRRFSLGEARHATRDAEARDAMLAALDDASRDVFGPEVPVAVRVQVEQARRRLESLADWHAARARDGWRIAHVEWSPGEDAVLDAGSVAMGITGRIDRVDVHEEAGVQLIDFKTGESVRRPESAHRARDGSWTDLQLPLYRHLARELLGDRSAALAYVQVPGDPAPEHLMVAQWSEEHLSSADDAARQVARAVAAGEFASPGSDPNERGIIAALLGLMFLGDAGDAGEADAEEPA